MITENNQVAASRITDYVLCFAQGGALGLLNAGYAAAIENRTGYPISSLVSLFSGASVGALHAAGLTLRDPQNPARPAHNATEYYKLFRTELPAWLPHDPEFYNRQILRRVFHTALGWLRLRPAIDTTKKHYDAAIPQGRLKALFGDATVGNALSSLAISTHRIAPEPAQACDFIHIDPARFDPDIFFKSFFAGQNAANVEEGRERENAPLRDVLMASIACPTVFPAIHVPHTNAYHIDLGGVNSPVQLVLALQAAKRPGHSLHFVYLGTACLAHSISPDAYNKADFLGTIPPYLDSQTAHVHSQYLSVIGQILGPENVTVLETALDKRDILDTRPEAMRALRHASDLALELHEDTLETLTQGMVTSHEARAGIVMPDAAFVRKERPVSPTANTAAAPETRLLTPA